MTRDVILDLLPLNLSGETSHDTRTLVDEFILSDPTLARFARRQAPDGTLAELPVGLPADHGTITLHKAKTLLWLRTLFLGFAVLSHSGQIRPQNVLRAGRRPLLVVCSQKSSASWGLLSSLGPKAVPRYPSPLFGIHPS